ncbi:hypothetical protein JCM16358_12800 [Halanaerocella petrolearia]
MIFIVLGTHELSFERLLNEVEKLKEFGIIEDKLIAQIGNTNFESDFIETKSFYTYEEMNTMYEEADLIITHGGTGSIIHGVEKEKKIIAVARLKKYNEHNDNHQKEIINKFKDAGYILEWEEDENLGNIIEKARRFTPNKYKSGKEKIIETIENFIGKN